jgi:hypothetical protein
MPHPPTVTVAAPTAAPTSSTHHRLLPVGLALLAAYIVLAYLALPVAWRVREHRHPALANAPRITHTGNGIPGDPLNVALVATETELHRGLLAACWFPADPVTLRTSLRIAADTVLRRSYDEAPVSSLYLWGRRQDYAFEQPVGNDPRRRHHVRFWRSAEVDDAGRPLWMGAATFDIRVGLSHTTGQITHHIGPNVDADRDKLIADLQQAGQLASVEWAPGFQTQLQGRNGGGDPYFTDGRLAVGVLKEAP